MTPPNLSNIILKQDTNCVGHLRMVHVPFTSRQLITYAHSTSVICDVTCAH